MNQTPCVLFVCTHNAARSQMAEVLLRHRSGNRFRACSAGFEPTEVHPLTRRVLEERGLDVTGLRSKPTRDFLGRVAVRYAVIVCEDAEPKCPRIFPFAANTLYWRFEDPAAPDGLDAEMQLARFRRVRDEIDARIAAWLVETGVSGEPS
jgi:arsenate reductase